MILNFYMKEALDNCMKQEMEYYHTNLFMASECRKRRYGKQTTITDYFYNEVQTHYKGEAEQNYYGLAV